MTSAYFVTLKIYLFLIGGFGVWHPNLCDALICCSVIGREDNDVVSGFVLMVNN